MKLKERCQTFGAEFKFFVQAGGCDGENRKQYPIWINKKDIPQVLIPYYYNYENLLTEMECCDLLREDLSHRVRTNDDSIVVMVSNTYDVFFNFTHMKPEWKIGNLKTDNPDELVRRIVEEDFPALNLARQVTMKELVERYGNAQSEKAFSLSDYKDYLLNKYLEDCYIVE